MAWADLISSLLLAADDAAGPEPSPWGGLISLSPLLLLVVFYFVLIQRPQRREQVARQEMLKNLKKNDHVLTTGGIYGVVTNVRSDSDEVTVRVDDATNTRLRMSRGAIAQVISDSSEGERETK